MKYIITESQYRSLIESTVPIHIRRRANEETLKHFISLGEMNYPTLCDDFDDPYDYVDAVIDYAIDEFGGGDIEDEDYYTDVMDYLRTVCRKLFGEYLIDVYNMTCTEENE
jgi:hypothetical protein